MATQHDFTRLWVDKHRPTSLAELDYDPELTEKLRQLGQCHDLPHLIFYGPPGIGKKTRVMALLTEIYGKGVQKYTKEIWSRKLNSTSVQVSVLSSKFHIDVTPSDADHHDKFVIQTLIKETASSGSVNARNSTKDFMTIVFNESEKISREAQAALRRTMEKYVDKCRIILITENLGNLIPAILSRCFLVRCKAPKEPEMRNVLSKVCEAERIRLDEMNCVRILQESSFNMRRALLNLQNTMIKKACNNLTTLIDWRDSIRTIVKEIRHKQNATTLRNVRCYDLLVNCIPPGMIIKEFLVQFLPHFADKYKQHLVRWAAYYENLLHLGSREMPFIEAFLAKVMVLLTEQKLEFPAGINSAGHSDLHTCDWFTACVLTSEEDVRYTAITLPLFPVVSPNAEVFYSQARVT